MKTLVLKNKFQSNVTLVTNEFIDNHMHKANGEFVKVYLFLLRHLDDPCSSITISKIADCLDNTEKDIIRAFKYWEAEGLLSLEQDSDGRITGIELEKTPVTARKASTTKTAPVSAAAPAKQSAGTVSAIPVDAAAALPAGDAISLANTAKPATAEESLPEPAVVPAPAAKKAIPLNSFKTQKELKSLLYIAEQYLGKTLSLTEVDTITYFYDTLKMSADLVEYLIESCVENGHKSIHYIQKVALSWSDDGITSVAEAQLRSMNYNKNGFQVLHAFGITNRGPAVAEIAYIKKWTDEYGFTLDIIQEACNRTIAAIHQPSFEYADTILKNWLERNVRHLDDVLIQDAKFHKEKESKKQAESRHKNGSANAGTGKNMNNFDRRLYDMDSLEEQLLNSNMKEHTFGT